MSALLEIAGVVPDRELVPADRAELLAMVRELAAARQPFAFVGGGSDLDFGNAPRPLSAAIRTTALDRVLDYAPEDQTITVEAGMRLADLDAVLAAHGQLVPIDAGDRTRATVGGAIATNAFGARRHRYGSIKDLILGIEIVRADGVAARGGGKVVKNVAGFDLPKLMVGALGTLGGILSATFRVLPIPPATAALALDADPSHPAALALLADRALDPVAVTHDAEEGLVLTFAGLGPAVDAQLERAAGHAAAHGVAARTLDAGAREGLAQRERAIRSSGAWRASCVYPPAGVSPLRAEPGTPSIAYPTLGVTRYAAERGFADAAVARARAAATVLFHAIPAGKRAALDAWGPPPPAFALMRALKVQFDPHGLCNPGRFVGGL